MHIVNTTYRPADGSCWITAHDARSVVDLLAAWVAEHHGDRLIDPPTSTWWIGFGWRPPSAPFCGASARPRPDGP